MATRQPMRKSPSSRRNDNGVDHSHQRHWYFEKRISLDTIVGLIGIAIVLGGPIFFWGRTIEAALAQTDKRITLIETATDLRKAFDTERENTVRDRQKETADKVGKLGEQMTLLQLAVGQLLSKTSK